MATTIIVLDANIIVDSPRLRKVAELMVRRGDWALRLVVPEVARMEAVYAVQRRWRDERNAIDKLRVGEFGLGEHQQQMLQKIDEDIDAYPETLGDELGKLEATTEPVPDWVTPMHLAERAATRKAPFKENSDKDCLRDTIIWHTLCQIAADNPDADVWFVSDNTQDFGQKGDRSECPLPLHTALANELEHQGIANLSYVVSIERLAQHLAGRYEGMGDSELRTRIDQIDSTDFARVVNEQMQHFELDPEAIAVSLTTARARTVSVDIDFDSVRYIDAAHRAADSWTSQFTLSATTSLEITDTIGNIAEQSKLLDITGTVTFGVDGKVQELVLSEVRAPDTDPMHRAWAHERQRQQTQDAVRGATRRTGFNTPFSSPAFGDIALSNAFVANYTKSFAVPGPKLTVDNPPRVFGDRITLPKVFGDKFPRPKVFDRLPGTKHLSEKILGPKPLGGKPLGPKPLGGKPLGPGPFRGNNPLSPNPSGEDDGHATGRTESTEGDNAQRDGESETE